MPVNQRIDRYELRGLLGRGAMGRVFRAWDTKLEREVALKLVSQGADPKSRERFHREVCAIAALRHPNIVEIYDYSGPDTEQLYYVMEKLDGDDLFNLMQAHGPLPEPAVAAVGHELCLALSVMHGAGIIHRDLKPENVFLSAQGRVVLTDFGVVKAVRHNSAIGAFDAKTDVVGTPGFMAPELLAGRQLGSYTDLFSLGALLYNVLTGEVPFAGTSPVDLHRAIVTGAVTDAREIDPHTSDSLWHSLRRCLSPRIKQRPRSADALRLDLEQVLDAYGVSDLRDELSDYMRSPAIYGEAARQRGARRLVQELAAAVEARDSTRVARLERRLARVDPDGREIAASTGLLAAARERAGRRPSARAAAAIKIAAVALGAALAVVVAVIVAGGGRLGPVGRWAHVGLTPVAHPAATPTAARSRHGSTPARVGGASSTGVAAPAAAGGARGEGAPDATPSPGLLEVRIKGRATAVTVGGERLSPRDLPGKRLPPGRYTVEVTGGKRRLSLDVEVAAGRRVVVSADVRRGSIRVR